MIASRYLRHLVAFLLLLTAANRVFALSDEVRARAQLVVERVNIYRRLSGLPPVTLDETLSDACVLHANYLDQNPDLVKKITLELHTEDPARPGYTQEGALAGGTSDITVFSGGDVMQMGVRSVEFDYNTFYHRTPILSRGLQTIGYGDNPGVKSGKHIALLRFGAANYVIDNRVVLTPPPGAAGIRPGGGGIEAPPPVPKFGTKSGNPIVAYLGFADSIQWVSSSITSTVKGKAKVLQHAVIAPNMPANPGFDGNNICLIAKKSLPKSALISVEIHFKRNGVDETLAWNFTTSSTTAFDPLAALAVAPPTFESGPTANVNSGTVGQAVQFSCSATDATAVTFEWNFGDGTTDTSGPLVTHSYTAAGTYFITVTATNANGKSATLGFQLRVN